MVEVGLVGQRQHDRAAVGFQVLPYFDQYALSHHFWAPDSSAIVLPLTDEANLDHVVVIPADGGDPHSVATGWVGFWSP